MKTTTTAMIAMLLAVFIAAGCGFECTVQGDKVPFAGCDDLQSRVDDEQAKAQPDGAIVDDLLTCGEVHGCNVEP